MNESWKRLVEAERRIARLESTLQRQNSRIVAANAAIRNDAVDPRTPFGSGGGSGGGTGSVHRFPEEFHVYVSWSSVPSLKTGASSNTAADGPALAEAVAFLASGVTLNLSTVVNDDGDLQNYFVYDTTSSRAALYLRLKANNLTTISGSSQYYLGEMQLALFDDAEFMVDPKQPDFTSGALFRADLGAISTSGQQSGVAIAWPRRNGGGSVIGSSTLTARRTLDSTDTFSTGPVFGEYGEWPFTMTSPETTYNTAGSGTLYIRWGTPPADGIDGGGPGTSFTDILDGGGPDTTFSDIIDGGTP